MKNYLPFIWGDTEAFASQPDFIFGISLLPAFDVDKNGFRAMASLPFPRDKYLIGCPAARGSIDIMTIQQNGEMTPCCDVGNLKCQPKFGNVLKDSPKQNHGDNGYIYEVASFRSQQKP